MDELEQLKSETPPSAVLRKLFISNFDLHSFSLYSINRDRKLVSDLLSDSTILLREETPFIKAMPIDKASAEYQVFSRPGFEDGWLYIVPDSKKVLVLYVEKRDLLKGTDLYALNFLVKIWFTQKRKSEFEDKIIHFQEQIKKIRTIGEHLAKQHKIKELLSKILKDSMEMVGAAKGHIMTYDEELEELKLQIVHGMANPAVDQLINEGKIRMEGIKPGQGIHGRVFESGETLKIDEITDHKELGADEDIHSIICVPLRMNEVAYGVLYVTNKQSGLPFTDTDLDLICILSSNVAAVMDQEKLFKESVTDHLTGLYTRRYFEPKLVAELLRAKRHNSDVSILAIDADFFKSVNDAYGHHSGDMALIEMANVINSCLRQNIDIAARFGGEEFFVFLPETGVSGAMLVAERIRAKMEATIIRCDEHRIRITLSIGVSHSRQQGISGPDLIRFSDEALYQSKSTGRNKVTLYRDND